MQTADLSPVTEVECHLMPCVGLALSRDGALLATGGNDAIVTVWDTASTVMVNSIYQIDYPCNNVSISHDGAHLAYTGATEKGRVASVEVAERFAEPGESARIHRCACVREHRRVALRRDAAHAYQSVHGPQTRSCAASLLDGSGEHALQVDGGCGHHGLRHSSRGLRGDGHLLEPQGAAPRVLWALWGPGARGLRRCEPGCACGGVMRLHGTWAWGICSG